MTGKPSEFRGEFDQRIVLGLLESIERGGVQSQRRFAADLGIALGLVNAYLRRCVKKGLIKVQHAPARRYAYYLTPHGFTEKAQLTGKYLVHSLAFFRRARADCDAALASAEARGWSTLALAGGSELAEVAALCALERSVRIVAVVDPSLGSSRLAGIPVYPGFESVTSMADGVLVTDLVTAQRTIMAATRAFGEARVLLPKVLDSVVQPIPAVSTAPNSQPGRGDRKQ
jgi:DNA-binding MarR family transcriptional regulator